MTDSRYILMDKSDLIELIQSIHDNVDANYASKMLATRSMAGLMSANDKGKLDNIDEGANNYVHPATSGNKHIPMGGSEGQILKWLADGTATWADEDYEFDTLTSADIKTIVDKAFR